MTVQTAIEAEERAEWNAARSAANLWRGRMVEQFAGVEHAVSEALIALKMPAGSKMPHLAGQRRAALRLALASSTEAGPQMRRAHDALAAFERLASHRTFLCHGASRILMDQRGEWHLHLRVLAPDDDAQAETEWTVSRTKSEMLLTETIAAARRVIDRLRHIRRA